MRTAQRVRPPRSGGAGGCDADRRDDGWGPHGTPPDHAAAMRLAALFDDAVLDLVHVPASIGFYTCDCAIALFDSAASENTPAV